MKQKNYDLLYAAVKTIANFTLDGEKLDGEPYEMTINQAFEDLQCSVNRCRNTMRSLKEGNDG